MPAARCAEARIDHTEQHSWRWRCVHGELYLIIIMISVNHTPLDLLQCNTGYTLSGPSSNVCQYVAGQAPAWHYSTNPVCLREHAFAVALESYFASCCSCRLSDSRADRQRRLDAHDECVPSMDDRVVSGQLPAGRRCQHQVRDNFP